MRTEAIKNFLTARTHPDLASLYHFGMELQVIVEEAGGTRIEGDFKGKNWHGYTDGFSTWKSFRIPLDPGGEPHYEDCPMGWDLDRYAKGIGMTGWNWQDRESVYVGYDFDAITGHADGHAKKLTDCELKAVQQAAWDIPWVTVRRSTSGNGIHLYVFLDGFPTANHTEHAAVARAILGKMSALTGYDFNARVDNVGGNFWVWHKKMAGTEGLALLKEGEILYDIPPNWRDHVDVIRKKARKTLPAVIAQSPIPDIATLFDDLTSQRSHVPLDEEHRRLIAWLDIQEGASAYWDQDRHMLVCHTYWLRQAHEELQLRGIFETAAKGSTQHDTNAFAFPMRRGVWSVRRFTPGVAEHASWTQDGSGWTSTYFNRDPDLDTASKAAGGIETPKGGFVFKHASEAVEASRQVGVNIELPPWAHSRKARLKEHRDGRLVVEIDHDANSDGMAGGLPGWLAEGKVWTRVFHANLRPQAEVEVGNYDDVIRHLVTETGDDAGWTIKSEGAWITEPLAHVNVALRGALGLSGKEVTAIVGSAVFRNWRIVNMPFQVEYPGDRQWNRGAAQFRYAPTENRENLQYPTWMKVLSHCGAGLDNAIREHGWCKANGILNGADYLKVWIASLFQRPTSPLPYLFFYSADQNTGKSIFHEAIAELVTKGVERADQALTNPSGFNGELANAVLCVVEETDLSRSKVAYNRIKDWVTSRQLPVHVKGLTPYTIPNTTHWCQCHPAETWVFTGEGPRQIRELIGRPVTVRYNGQSYATDGFFPTGERELFEIVTVEGFKLRATSEHPVSVDFDGIVLDQRVDQLVEGSRLCLCNHTQPEWPGEGTFEEGYIVGSLVGDGNICRDPRYPDTYKHHLLFCEPDYCMVNWVAELFPEYPQVHKYGNEFRLMSPYLEELREKYGLDDRKVINVHIESASSEFQRGFLSAFFDNDGGATPCAGPNAEIRLNQSNLARMEAVQRMLIHFGIVGEIRESVAGEWVMAIRRSNIVRFQKLIGFQHPEKRALADLYIKRYRGIPRQVEDFTVRVKSIRSVGVHPTFDVTVPGVNHFSANGFSSHNCSNSHTFCPVLPGDTRITMIYVSPLDPAELIPKEQLLQQLRKEAPDFMAEILALEIPPSGDRLAVPVIVTGEKLTAQRQNLTKLEEFILDRCHNITGRTIKLSEFVQAFHDWLDPGDVIEWSKQTVGKNLPPQFPKGRRPQDNQFHIGNISWEPRKPGEAVLPRLVLNTKELLVPVEAP